MLMKKIAVIYDAISKLETLARAGGHRLALGTER
jgi:hypothetical protein